MDTKDNSSEINIFRHSTPKVSIEFATEKLSVTTQYFLELAAQGHLNLWFLLPGAHLTTQLDRGEWLKANQTDIYESLSDKSNSLTVSGEYQSGENRRVFIASTTIGDFYVKISALYLEFPKYNELLELVKNKHPELFGEVKSKVKKSNQGQHHSQKREQILSAGFKALATAFEEYIKKPNDNFLKPKNGEKLVNIAALSRYIDDHRSKFDLPVVDESNTAPRGTSHKNIGETLRNAYTDKTLSSTD